MEKKVFNYSKNSTQGQNLIAYMKVFGWSLDETGNSVNGNSPGLKFERNTNADWYKKIVELENEYNKNISSVESIKTYEYHYLEYKESTLLLFLSLVFFIFHPLYKKHVEKKQNEANKKIADAKANKRKIIEDLENRNKEIVREAVELVHSEPLDINYIVTMLKDVLDNYNVDIDHITDDENNKNLYGFRIKIKDNDTTPDVLCVIGKEEDGIKILTQLTLFECDSKRMKNDVEYYKNVTKIIEELNDGNKLLTAFFHEDDHSIMLSKSHDLEYPIHYKAILFVFSSVVMLVTSSNSKITELFKTMKERLERL